MDKILTRLVYTLSWVIILSLTLSACGDNGKSTPPNPEPTDIRVGEAEAIRTIMETEDFPLRNCGGTSELTQSLGTQATVKKGVTVGAKATTTAGAEVAIPEAVKIKLEVQVELAYQQTYEMASSRLYTIEMKAAPGTSVVYVIQWEEQKFTSAVSYAMKGEVYRAPYEYVLQVPKVSDSYQTSCPPTPTPIITSAPSTDTPTPTDTPVPPAPSPTDTPAPVQIEISQVQGQASAWFGDSPAYVSVGEGQSFIVKKTATIKEIDIYLEVTIGSTGDQIICNLRNADMAVLESSSIAGFSSGGGWQSFAFNTRVDPGTYIFTCYLNNPYTLEEHYYGIGGNADDYSYLEGTRYVSTGGNPEDGSTWKPEAWDLKFKIKMEALD